MIYIDFEIVGHIGQNPKNFFDTYPLVGLGQINFLQVNTLDFLKNGGISLINRVEIEFVDRIKLELVYITLIFFLKNINRFA